MHFNETTEVDSVERIVTLIESKGAIYRGHITNIFDTYRGMHKTSTALIEDYMYFDYIYEILAKFEILFLVSCQIMLRINTSNPTVNTDIIFIHYTSLLYSPRMRA